MSYIYRCSCCRTRNTFRRALVDYVRPRRCRSCRHTRFYVDRERATRKACHCAGYHHAHRPGSRCCDSNPAADYWRAKREGADDETLLAATLRAAGRVVKSKTWCPF